MREGDSPARLTRPPVLGPTGGHHHRTGRARKETDVILCQAILFALHFRVVLLGHPVLVTADQMTHQSSRVDIELSGV